MSLLDQVRDIERQVVKRLRELEPLMREYEQLRKAAQRLGVKYSPRSQASAGTEGPSADGDSSATATAGTGGTGTRRTRAGRQTSRSGTRSRAGSGGSGSTRSRARTGTRQRSASRTAAAPGQRQEEVLRLVGEQPGITVSELGQRLSVNPTGLYRVTRKLTAEGRLRKDGTQLYPTGQSEAGAATSESTPPPDDAA